MVTKVKELTTTLYSATAPAAKLSQNKIALLSQNQLSTTKEGGCCKRIIECIKSIFRKIAECLKCIFCCKYKTKPQGSIEQSTTSKTNATKPETHPANTITKAQESSATEASKDQATKEGVTKPAPETKPNASSKTSSATKAAEPETSPAPVSVSKEQEPDLSLKNAKTEANTQKQAASLEKKQAHTSESSQTKASVTDKKQANSSAAPKKPAPKSESQEPKKPTIKQGSANPPLSASMTSVFSSTVASGSKTAPVSAQTQKQTQPAPTVKQIFSSAASTLSVPTFTNDDQRALWKLVVSEDFSVNPFQSFISAEAILGKIPDPQTKFDALNMFTDAVIALTAAVRKSKMLSALEEKNLVGEKDLKECAKQAGEKISQLIDQCLFMGYEILNNLKADDKQKIKADAPAKSLFTNLPIEYFVANKIHAFLLNLAPAGTHDGHFAQNIHLYAKDHAGIEALARDLQKISKQVHQDQQKKKEDEKKAPLASSQPASKSSDAATSALSAEAEKELKNFEKDVRKAIYDAKGFFDILFGLLNDKKKDLELTRQKLKEKLENELLLMGRKHDLQSEDFKRKLALVDKFAKDGNFNLVPALLDSTKAMIATIDEQLAKIEEKIKEAKRLNKDAEVKVLTKLQEDITSSLSRSVGFSASAVRRLSDERSLSTFAELNDIRELLSKKSVNLEPGTPRGVEPITLKTAPKIVPVFDPYAREKHELKELVEKVPSDDFYVSFAKAKGFLDIVQDPQVKFEIFGDFISDVLENVYTTIKTKPEEALKADHPATLSSIAHERIKHANVIMRRCIELSDETIAKLDPDQKKKINIPKVDTCIHNKLYRDLGKLELDPKDDYFKYVQLCLNPFISTLQSSYSKDFDKYLN